MQARGALRGACGQICWTPSGIAWCRAHTPIRGVARAAAQNWSARRTTETDEIVLIHHVFSKAPASGEKSSRRGNGRFLP
jgi:hypothetical protein